VSEHPQAALAVPATDSAAGGKRVMVLGIPLLLCSFEQAVARIRTMISIRFPQHVVLANAHTLNLACEHPAYRSVLRRAAIVLRDGVGVELAVRHRGLSPAHNFVGTDFVPAMLNALGPRELRVFLLGGRNGVAEAAGKILASRMPHLRLVGAANGYGARVFAIEQIRETRPDVLLVGLGNPMQERWIDAHLGRLGVPVSIGVGALFDFLAGRVPRAPRWLLRLRGEWLFRLAVEPRRLWRRYVLGNPRFLWRALHDHGGHSW
jgi:N-acetylglucosaminyldiphosphoundecaprenol N-acetyl-beta-D-mannosaminyltransferase